MTYHHLSALVHHQAEKYGNEFKRMRTFYQKYIKNHAVIISKG